MRCEVPTYMLTGKQKTARAKKRKEREEDLQSEMLTSSTSTKRLRCETNTISPYIFTYCSHIASIPPMVSSFRPIGGSTPVQFALATILVDKGGQPTVQWPDLEDGQLALTAGTISDALYAQGLSQNVYKVSLRFFSSF